MENEINTQNKIFGKTFFWMFLGLLGSGIIAWYTYTSGLYMNFFYKLFYAYIINYRISSCIAFYIFI